eukprot:433479-Hanusia_phi.AAC.1
MLCAPCLSRRLRLGPASPGVSASARGPPGRTQRIAGDRQKPHCPQEKLKFTVTGSSTEAAGRDPGRRIGVTGPGQ